MKGPHPYRCVETGALIPAWAGTMIHAVGAHRYPQVDGVPSLQTRARSRDELDAQLGAIRAGGRRAVLDWLAAWSRGQGYRFEALRRVIAPGSRGDFHADWAGYCGTEDHYFLIRWACPSYLANLAFLGDMAGRRVACLASGVGHFSSLLRALSPRPAVTMLDGNLIHLLVARAYLAPGEQAVCAELDDPLPLPDETFDVAAMNDAFHYVDAKPALLGEMRRILKPDGQALVLHVHDPRDLGGESVPGSPLTPLEFAGMARAAGWSRLEFFAERALVRDLVRLGANAVPAPRDAADLPPGPYAVRLFKGAAPVAHPWRLSPDRDGLSLNPVYRADAHGCRRLDWRGSERNRLEFGDTPLPPALTDQDLAGDACDLFRRGILVPGSMLPSSRREGEER